MRLHLLLAFVLACTAGDAGAATIFVTVLDQRPISAGPGCSLQEAIYSSVLHDTLDGTHGIAIDATDPDHFITTQCVRGCHVKLADEARKGKAFDEEACEETDAKKSCRAKYDAAGVRLLATAGACPECLGSVEQAALAEEAERSVDAVRGNIFCAGTEQMARWR